MTDQTGAVLGVMGGSGGVGSSTFAAVLAATADSSVLIDLDVSGGGIDVALGLEQAPGTRWSGLRVAGGRLDPALIREGLLHWGSCLVLAADPTELDAAAVLQVLDAARVLGPVVLDLPRGACDARAAALPRCDLVVVVVRADVVGLVAAHAVVAALPELPIGVVVRRGGVQPDEAAALVGVPLLGVLPALGTGGWIRGPGSQPRAGLDPRRLPRQHARVAAGILDGLPRPNGLRDRWPGVDLPGVDLPSADLPGRAGLPGRTLSAS